MAQWPNDTHLILIAKSEDVSQFCKSQKQKSLLPWAFLIAD
jgi:hypothetical protein